MSEFELRPPRLTIKVPDRIAVTTQRKVELKAGDEVELRVTGVIADAGGLVLSELRTVEVVAVRRR